MGVLVSARTCVQHTRRRPRTEERVSVQRSVAILVLFCVPVQRSAVFCVVFHVGRSPEQNLIIIVSRIAFIRSVYRSSLYDPVYQSSLYDGCLTSRTVI